MKNKNMAKATLKAKKPEPVAEAKAASFTKDEIAAFIVKAGRKIAVRRERTSIKLSELEEVAKLAGDEFGV